MAIYKLNPGWPPPGRGAGSCSSPYLLPPLGLGSVGCLRHGVACAASLWTLLLLGNGPKRAAKRGAETKPRDGTIDSGTRQRCARAGRLFSDPPVAGRAQNNGNGRVGGGALARHARADLEGHSVAAAK